MKMRLSVHLVTGEVVNTPWSDDEMTDDEIKQTKELIEEIVGSNGGWQVNLAIPGPFIGAADVKERYVVFPKHAVLYVEIETKEA